MAHENEGFISLYRSILRWEWYNDIPTCRLFIHLLLTANYKDARSKGRAIRRGQCLTSIKKLAKETGLTFQQTRTALEHLKSTNEITSVSNPQGTVITVKNYVLYQRATCLATNDQQTTNIRSNKRPTHDQHTTSNKDNKEKREKKIPSLSRLSLPVYGEFKNVHLSDAEIEKLRAVSASYLKYIEALSGHKESKGAKYKNDYATLRNWIRRDEKKEEHDDDQERY